MASLTLKNVPEELLVELKARARQNRRSLNQETLVRLERSLAEGPRDLEGRIAALERLHRKMADLPAMDEAFLARAKDEGRS